MNRPVLRFPLCQFRLRLGALAAGLALALAGPAQATDYTWVGPADGGSWFDPANWQSDSPFGSSPFNLDTALFTTNARISGSAVASLLTNQAQLTLSSGGTVVGEVVNNGRLTVGDLQGLAFLRLGSSARVSGNGLLVLSDAWLEVDQLVFGSGVTLGSGQTVEVQRSARLSSYSSLVPFSNLGTVQVTDESRLSLLGQTTLDNSAGTLRLGAYSSLDGGTVTAGLVQADAGSRISNSRLVGLRLDADPSQATMTSLTGMALDSVRLGGNVVLEHRNTASGTLVVDGQLNVGRGFFSDDSLELASGSVLAGLGRTVLGDGARLVAMDPGGTAVVTIAAGHTVQGGGRLTGGFGPAQFINHGTIAVTFDNLSVDAAVTGAGTLDIGFNGSVFLGGGYNASFGQVLIDRTGALTFTGRLEVNLLQGELRQFTGSFAAGLGAAEASISGNYELFGGQLAVHLAAGPGAGHDQVHVGGDLKLFGGDLVVTLDGGFSAQEGEQFLILAVDGRRSGSFSGLAEGAEIAVGQHRFSLTYAGGDGNDVALVAHTPAPVPEPASGLLLLAGLAGLAGTRPRRAAQMMLPLQ